MLPFACHRARGFPPWGAAVFVLSSALGPAALGYLELPQDDPRGPFHLLDTPGRHLRLAEAWRPPTRSFWAAEDGSIEVDRLSPLADVFEHFFGRIQLAVPDSSTVGVTSEKTVTGMAGVLASVQVQIHLTPRGDQPMFNGDFHVTLSHDSGYAVLINRAGRRDGFSAGYADSGFNVTLSDQATADIHNYRVAATGSHTTPLSLTDDPAGLTGTWQPDGRTADPSQVLPTSPRDAMLDRFVGLDPNGVWTLHVADLNSNGLGQLVEWSLTLTTVPEPPQTLLAFGLSLGLFALARRRSASASFPNPPSF